MHPGTVVAALGVPQVAASSWGGHRALGTTALLALTLAPFAPANAAPRPGPVHQVGEVVVTATRSETPLERVASSVTVISAEEIERRQYRLVTDALRRVPGVDVRRNGGPGTNTSIFIRGGDSDQVLVLLDGVELNDPSSPSRVPLLNHLTTDNVERIEVVRGPQSSLYGGDAMSGVIQIFTRRGEGELSAVASAEGGSYDTARGALELGGSAGDLRYRLAASHWHSNGFSAAEAGSEDDAYRNTSTSGSFGWEPHEHFTLDGMVHFTRARVEFDGFSGEDHHRTEAEQVLARIAPQLQLFDDRWKQTLAFEFSRNKRDTCCEFGSDVEGILYGVDWQHDLQLGESHELSLGVENQWEEADFDLVSDFVDFDDSRYTVGVYLLDRFSFGERWFGTLGARFDDPNDFESRVTYRVTAGVSLPEISSVLRSSYGTGYKAPSLSQLNPNAFGGSRDLDPETAEGWDVGIEHSRWDGRLVASATFFYNDVKDLIVALCDPVSFSCLNFNVDRSRARGVETSLALELLPSLRTTASYTYTRTEARGTPARFGEQDGERLLRRPTHKANLELVFSFLEERAELAASLLWVGNRRDLGPAGVETNHSYATVDLASRYRVNEWLEVYGRVDNLFDEDYEDVLGFGTAGISAYGGIRLRY